MSVLKKQTNKHWFIVNCIVLFFYMPHLYAPIHAYLTHLFSDRVTTELDAYALLTADPLSHEVNYIAIPWSVLINSQKLHLVPQVQFNGGFTICQHIYFRTIIPVLKEMSIDVLFTPHAEKNVDYGMTVLPFPHTPVNGIGPASYKDKCYSFIGFGDTHPIRKEIFKLKKPSDVIIKERYNWHFWAPHKEHEKQEYQNVLSRSRFSLCPRGTGPSTIRFWESLQAGAIPVLYGNDLWLPEEYDWSSCIVYISEKEVKKTDDILRAIPLEQEERMRASCLEAYRQFCEENLVSTIRNYYKDQK